VDCHVLPLCFGGCPHRHVYGAPEEHTCNQIRYSTEETLVLEYAAKHRKDLVAPLQEAAIARKGGGAGCSSCTQTPRI
jgi:sulfatase maturation enzyme AslB (radical SAM superfamily)